MRSGRPPLPYTPCPFPGELLSSWLKRIAAEFRVTLTHLVHHVGLSSLTREQIDTALTEADIRAIAVATRSSAGDIRKMIHRPLSGLAKSLVAGHRPIQFCARCRAHHGATTSLSVALKPWFEYWQIECSQCRIPFEAVVRPDLYLSNPAREDPEWFNRLLPTARAGGARLADFAKRPLHAVITPIAVLNLMSMRLTRTRWASGLAGYKPDLDRCGSHCIAELFVSGLRERMSQELIPHTWTAKDPVRLVAARAILLAAMETFLQDARQAFMKVTHAAPATTAVVVDRWLARLPPHSRQLLIGRD
jgi:hypothetical protein